ncbi:hypothetical protein KAR91_29940 [Candidatus Pacearchaeota archaeon]|nr:hypothetical protein [Candidatus Pacearchaeota archaeon]
MIDPIWKEHTFKVMEQAPEAKCVSLLSQVMDEFNTLSPSQKDAIAKWFGKNYEREVIGKEEIYIEGVDKPLTYKIGLS